MTRPTGRPMGRPRVHHVRRLVDHPAPTPQSTPCRLWQGATSGNSYGTLRVGQDKVYVHRWVWEQANGPIPPGMQIMHHCDQPLCYRLDHLALGTRSDNMMDMSRKGRGRQIMQRTECGKGHPLEQLGQCITCKREVQKLAARRKRARARAAQLSTVALLAVALLMIPGHGIAGDSLSRGDTGPRVAEVQSILASMQYSVTVDGVYGKQTERAVRSWQRSNGLVVDGIVGASTLQSLRSATRINNAHTVGAPADPTSAIEHYDIWVRLAVCESGSRWDYNGSSGYDGGLQFSPRTWTAMGGGEFAPYAWQASMVEQMVVAERTLDAQGWGAWPTCARRLGLR
jgi:hypothetical protein